MARLATFGLVFLVVLAVCSLAVLGDCPPSGQHTRCDNKCIHDSECSHMGGKCCPNLCNFRSCVLPKAADKANAGYKGSSSGGAYCGNTKCSSFEKCQQDKSTSRPKCVRA